MWIHSNCSADPLNVVRTFRSAVPRGPSEVAGRGTFQRLRGRAAARWRGRRCGIAVVDWTDRCQTWNRATAPCNARARSARRSEGSDTTGVFIGFDLLALLIDQTAPYDSRAVSLHSKPDRQDHRTAV